VLGDVLTAALLWTLLPLLALLLSPLDPVSPFGPVPFVMERS